MKLLKLPVKIILAPIVLAMTGIVFALALMMAVSTRLLAIASSLLGTFALLVFITGDAKNGCIVLLLGKVAVKHHCFLLNAATYCATISSAVFSPRSTARQSSCVCLETWKPSISMLAHTLRRVLSALFIKFGICFASQLDYTTAAV